jgi:hypothetical protein
MIELELNAHNLLLYTTFWKLEECLILEAKELSNNI